MRTWKLVLCCILGLLLLSGCAKTQAPDDALDFGAPKPSAAPAQSPPSEDLPAAAAGKENAPPTSVPATAGGTGGLNITGSVSYAFAGMLYGGVSYTNESDAAMRLSEATFTFTYPNGTQQNTFVPVAAENDVVAPGETAYCTLWLPYDDTAGRPDSVTLQAQLSGAAATLAPRQLTVENARLIQNYPGFATLSGRLSNPGTDACDLNMVYVGFYDQNGALLGVWHFTRNAVLQAGDGAAFVVHLQALPIEGLCENTAEMRFHAFGI